MPVCAKRYRSHRDSEHRVLNTYECMSIVNIMCKNYIYQGKHMKILSRIGDVQWKEKEGRATLRAGNAARETTRETPHGRPRRRLRERPHTGDHTRETTQGRPHGRPTGDASGTISKSFREPYPETAGKTHIFRWPSQGKPKGDTRETALRTNFGGENLSTGPFSTEKCGHFLTPPI